MTYKTSQTGELRLFQELGTLFLLCFLVRFACLLVSRNNGWDAVIRSQLAWLWAKDPFWLPPRNVAPQYGILPLYLMGLALKLFPSVTLTPRFFNLFVGSASIIPFFLWVKTAFDNRVAKQAAFFFIFFSLHVKSSGLAASEPLYLFCWLYALYYFYRYRNQTKRVDLLWSAVWLNFAGMCRYNGWFFIALFALLLLRPGMQWRDLRSFVKLALFFPLLWMGVCSFYYGDPLYPLKFVRYDHLRILTALGGLHFQDRIYYLFFFPVVLMLSLSPPVFWQAVVNSWQFARKKEQLPLLLIGGSWASYLTCLAVLGGNFMLLARFSLEAGVVLLPLAAYPSWSDGEQQFFSARFLRKSIVIFFFLLAGGAYFLPAALGKKLTAVSPVTNLSNSQQTVITFIKEEIPPTAIIMLPHTPHWEEVEIAFYAKHQQKLFTRSWQKKRPPAYLILHKPEGVRNHHLPQKTKLCKQTKDFMIYQVAGREATR